MAFAVSRGAVGGFHCQCFVPCRGFSFSHTAGQTEGRGDGGEDGDNHVDDHLPGFCFIFYGHNELGVRN